MDRIELKALAKINLGLDVLRRREDGYHEVKMIMQTIGLCDELEIRKTKQPGIQVETNLYYLPTNENNLVYKAAQLLKNTDDSIAAVAGKVGYENQSKFTQAFKEQYHVLPTEFRKQYRSEKHTGI